MNRMDITRQKQLNAFKGDVVIDMIYDTKDTGICHIFFKSGRKLEFSSVGDDMTYLDIVEVN